MDSKCKICKKKFNKKPGAKGIYCSHECMNIGKITAVEIECGVCKKKFFTNRASGRKYCSRECYYEMKRIRGDRVVWTDEMRERVSKKMSGVNNHGYGKPSKLIGRKRPDITGENHPNYKRGFYVNKDGYKIIGRRTRSHRSLVEDFLGRKLSKEEIIHHIDGDKLNNSITNLRIVSRSEHAKIHSTKNNPAKYAVN